MGPPDMPPADMDIDAPAPGGRAGVEEEEGEEIVVEKLRSAAEIPQGGGLGGDTFSESERPPVPQEASPAVAATPEDGPMRMEENTPSLTPTPGGGGAGGGGGGLDDLMAGSGGPEIGTPSSLRGKGTQGREMYGVVRGTEVWGWRGCCGQA